MQNRSKRLSAILATAASSVMLVIPYVALAVDPLHPLGKTTIETVIGRVIGAALSLMGVVSFAVFVWSGFSWMVAAGSAEKIKMAKRSMVYAVTGLIVCFASFAILRFFFDTVLIETQK